MARGIHSRPSSDHVGLLVHGEVQAVVLFLGSILFLRDRVCGMRREVKLCFVSKWTQHYDTLS